MSVHGCRGGVTSCKSVSKQLQKRPGLCQQTDASTRKKQQQSGGFFHTKLHHVGKGYVNEQLQGGCFLH